MYTCVCFVYMCCKLGMVINWEGRGGGGEGVTLCFLCLTTAAVNNVCMCVSE